MDESNLSFLEHLPGDTLRTISAACELYANVLRGNVRVVAYDLDDRLRKSHDYFMKRDTVRNLCDILRDEVFPEFNGLSACYSFDSDQIIHCAYLLFSAANAELFKRKILELSASSPDAQPENPGEAQQISSASAV